MIMESLKIYIIKDGVNMAQYSKKRMVSGVASASKSDEALAVTGAVRGWTLRNVELLFTSLRQCLFYLLPRSDLSLSPSLFIYLSRIHKTNRQAFLFDRCRLGSGDLLLVLKA